MSFVDMMPGSVMEISAEGPAGLWPRRPAFVSLSFGRGNSVRIFSAEYPKGGSISVRDLKQMRRIRSICNHRVEDYLVRAVCIDDFADDSLQADTEVILKGKLTFLFPARVSLLGSKVFILFPDDLLRQAESISDVKAKEGILSKLLLTVPRPGSLNARNTYLFRKPIGLAEVDSVDSDIVHLITSDRRVIGCRRRQNALGTDYLEATEISDLQNGDQKRVEFIKLDCTDREKMVIPIESPEQAMVGNSLGVFSREYSTIMSAWLQYKKVEIEEQNRVFTLRASSPLIFSGASQEQGANTFSLVVDNWAAVGEKWTDLEKLPKNHSAKINASVHITCTKGIDEVRAVLTNVKWGSNGARATVQVTEKGRFNLPDSGFLKAIKEKDSQDKNSMSAVSTLENGSSALPTLLDILNEPSSAEPTVSRSFSKTGSFNSSQIEAIEKALGNKSIVAVQGPPGSGKTHVIVEIVKNLLKRHTEGRPVRVLLSCEQNEALINAAAKLSKNVFLYSIVSKVQESKNREKMFDSDQQQRNLIRENFEKRKSENPSLQRILSFSQMLSEFRSSLDGMPEGMVETKEWIRQTVFSSKDAVKNRFRTLFGQGEELLQRIDTLQSRPENPDSSALRVGSSDLLQSILKTLEESKDCPVSIDEQLLGLEGSMGDPFFIEQLRDKVKSRNRSIRRGEQIEDVEELRIECICMVQNEMQKISFSSSGTDSALSVLNADIASWYCCLRSAVDNEIEATNEGVIGILDQWRKDLEDNTQWELMKSRYSLVTSATCQKSGALSNDVLFDYVIVDESARAAPLNLVVPITKGKKILLVGDQKQLPVMVDKKIEKILNSGSQSYDPGFFEQQTLFSELFEKLPKENKVMLDIQYRCHPVIGEAWSRAFYEGKVHCGSKLPWEKDKFALEKKPCWDIYDNEPLVWIDVIPDESPVYEDNGRESLAIAMEVDSLIKSGKCSKTQFVGIIAFYQKQVDKIESDLNRIIGSQLWRSYAELGTVDSFQGKEYPLVMLSCSKYNTGSVGFLSSPNRINVAVSRPQKQLLIFGSRETILNEKKGSMPFKLFVQKAGTSIKFVEGN